MLMTRQAVLSPRRNIEAIDTLRFQLLVMWAFAVALPGLYVYLGFITAESERAILNSVAGAALATLVGLIALRRVNEFPGVKSYSLILPSLAGAFGLILVLFLGARLSYSRSVLAGSAGSAILVSFVLAYLVERFVRPCFFIVPGGDVQALQQVEEATWVTMTAPTIPTSPKAMLVADFRHNHPDEWERMLARAAISGRVVYHSKLLNESLTGRVTIEHLSENGFGSLLPNLAYRKIKRMTDIVASIAVLPLLLPAAAVIAILIKLDSPGPVIFRQQRVGYRGEVFWMFKFRSMRTAGAATSEDAARQDAMTRDDDDRITRIGRFLRRARLDELPQILNILRGQMSWIGPRPEAVALSKWYESEIPFYSYRHIVRPGITGWAQVHQGHVTDLHAINQKLAYDFYYVKYFSAWLDIVIALRTIPTMLGGFGAR